MLLMKMITGGSWVEPSLCVDFCGQKMKVWGLLVFLLFCAQRSGASDRGDSCKYPPSQWCRSLKIAIECQVSAPRINSLELSSPKLGVVLL